MPAESTVHHRRPPQQEDFRTHASEGSEEGATEIDGKTLPWWKKPSPLWLLAIMPFSAIVASATIAPRIEIYTALACRAHRPEYLSCGKDNPNVTHYQSVAHLSEMNISFHRSLLDFPLDRHHSVDFIFTAPSQNDTGQQPNRCTSDPVVRAAVAKLTLAISTSMGILGCLTVGWWGSYSDRHGRTRVLAISVFGLLLADLNVILVARLYQYLPGGYWFLLVSPIIEGCLGGMTSMTAAMHAYMADCSDPGSRSRIFSLSYGLLFVGIALGPTFGGFLVRYTHQILFPFYVAAGMHVVYALIMWLVVPESLSSVQMIKSVEKWRAKTAHGLPTESWKKMFKFLTPLNIFFSERDDGNSLRRRCDWNLVLVVVAYGFTVSLVGSWTYKLQYAQSTFGWTSEEMGYWLSLVGASRAVYMTIVLPVAIKLLKPHYIPLTAELPDDTQPLLASTPVTPDASAPVESREPHFPSFDLGLARISLVFHILSYTFMAFAASPTSFTLLGVVSALGEGFSAAVQSVALELYTRRGSTESGRLFGALSVVQALCAQILGPALFGLTYVTTVAAFPRAIFFLSVVAVLVSLIVLSFVRLPKVASPDPDLVGDDMEPPTYGGTRSEEAI